MSPERDFETNTKPNTMPSGPPRYSGRGKKPLIVCVDDEPGILGALRRLLSDEPYEVLATEKPQEALEWLSSHKVSLLIVDQRMPAMSGVELLQAAEECSPKTARIMLTAYPSDPMVVRGVGENTLVLVGKPWDDTAFRELIRDYVRL